jgi:hypothetical protein
LVLNLFVTERFLMQSTIYVSLVSMLGLALVQAPNAFSAVGSGSAPIGTILQATRVDGEVDTRYEGTTIFDGETLRTDDVNLLRIQFGGPQMEMRSNSAAEVHRIENGFSTTLTAGTVVISTREGQMFRVLADGATIQPLGEGAATAQITRLSPTKLVVTPQKGALVISMLGENKTLEPGTSYQLEIHPDVESNAEPLPGPPAPGKSHFTTFLLAVVPVATVFVGWRAMVSPHKP